MDIPAKAVSFFWARVAKSESCWLWYGSLAPNGYGIVYVKYLGARKQWSMGAHRFSWILHHGEIPTGKSVLHQCDVKACVNPAHLELGTAWKNSVDAVTRGRIARGQQHYNAKLTDEIVREARRLFLSKQATAKALAKRFGVSHAVMHEAIRGKTWKHVKETI